MIFLDSAKIKEIKDNIDLIDGCTINPTLMSKAGIKTIFDIVELISDIRDIAKNKSRFDLSIQLPYESKSYYKYWTVLQKMKHNKSFNLICKIPVIEDYLKCFPIKRGCNATIVVQKEQIDLLKKYKFEPIYISIFYNRIKNSTVFCLNNHISRLFYEINKSFPESEVIFGSIHSKEDFLKLSLTYPFASFTVPVNILTKSKDLNPKDILEEMIRNYKDK